MQDYLRELYSLVKTRNTLLDHAAIHKLLLEDYLPLLIQSIPPRALAWARWRLNHRPPAT